MKRVSQVVALCLLLAPAWCLADTLQVPFTGGTVLGPSDSSGTMGISGATVDSISIDSVALAAAGSVSISLSGFVPTIAGKTITTGDGVFDAGSVALNCTNCDGYSGLAFTGDLAGLDWTVSKSGQNGTLGGSLTGSFSPGFAAILGTVTGGTIGDTITVYINDRINGPGDMTVDYRPNPNVSHLPVPEAPTLPLLGAGMAGLLGLAGLRRAGF